jgi:hypothetical protein
MKSKRFYDRRLGFFGFKLEWEFDHTVGWNNGKTMFWIGEGDARGKKYKYRAGNIGFHHYAFGLSTRRAVDDLYKCLKNEKVTVVDPLADYPDYGEGYYTVSRLDPDGLKLEGMFFLKRERNGRPGKNENRVWPVTISASASSNRASA